MIDNKRVEMGYPMLASSPSDLPHFGYDEVQPQHVRNAGAIGLGEWRDDKIQLVEHIIG